MAAAIVWAAQKLCGSILGAPRGSLPGRYFGGLDGVVLGLVRTAAAVSGRDDVAVG